MKEKTVGQKLILGLQHVLAMFGATVLVPALTGLNTSITLMCAGIGTLIFASQPFLKADNDRVNRADD